MQYFFERRGSMFLVIVLYAVFSGMTFINSALMAGNPYPLIVGMIRAVGSGVIILGLVGLIKREKIRDFKLTFIQWRWLILYGVLIHAIGMFGFSWSVLYGNPVTLCFIFATAPFLTAIIQYGYGQEPLSTQKAVGLLVGSIGLIPILLQDSSTAYTQASGTSHAWFMSNGVAIGSMVLFCYGWVVFKKLLHTTKYSIQLLNGMAMSIGGILSTLGVVCVYGSSVFQLPYTDNFSFLMGVFLLSSLMTYSLYAYLLQTFSPTFISFAGFLEPAFGMIYGYFLTNYRITGIDLAAFLVLFLGLYIFYLDELKKKP